MTSPGPAADWRGLHPRLLVLRRVECLLLLGLPTLVASGVLLVARGPAQATAALLVGAALLVLALSGVQRRFAAWAYAEREDDLLLRRGVLFRRTSVVPYGRMQYVDVTAGPARPPAGARVRRAAHGRRRHRRVHPGPGRRRGGPAARPARRARRGPGSRACDRAARLVPAGRRGRCTGRACTRSRRCCAAAASSRSCSPA